MRTRYSPSLLKTWFNFFLILLCFTFSLRLLSGWMMVPDSLWDTAWWWGLRFDIAISALLAGLTVLAIWLPSRFGLRVPRRGWLAPAGLVLASAHFADWLYWRETGRHIGYEAADLFNSAGSLSNMLILQWPWLLAIALVTLSMGCVRWAASLHVGRGLRLEGGLLLVLILSTLAVRGGVNGLPQGPDDAMRMPSAGQAVAALNGAYSALYGLQSSGSDLNQVAMPWLDAKEAERKVSELYPARGAMTEGQPEKINLIFVVLESWATTNVRANEDSPSITPNFDAIAARSLHAEAMVAAGMRTTEGLFALFCSYQNPLGQTLAKSPLALNDYDCLPRRLREIGWSTAFFQGSHENTSGVGAYAQSMGFDVSEGKDSINKPGEPQNAWGVYDATLYRYVLERMEVIQEPMLVGINTNTTHDTQLHDDAPKLTSGKSRQDIERNVLHLADRELGGFLEALHARDWELPWALVLASDHTARVAGSNLERFQVPFALYMPGRVEPHVVERVAHHRDVAPTLADLLSLDMPFAMGHSLFDVDAPQIAEYFTAGTLGWFIGRKRLVEFPLADPNLMNCYDWQDNIGLEQPVKCRADVSDEVANAYALTQQAQQKLFEGRALQLVPGAD